MPNTTYSVILFVIGGYYEQDQNSGDNRGCAGISVQEYRIWRTFREAIEQLGENQAGILVLHHAILAFPQWPLWSDLCGIQDRSFGFKVDQNLHVDIVDSQHPILRGLAPWEMVDETYIMADPGDDSDLLLTTDHPESMKTLAWTRQYKNARVFCCQSGHDNQVFADSNFRTVIARGIQWLAGRI